MIINGQILIDMSIDKRQQKPKTNKTSALLNLIKKQSFKKK